MTPEEHALAVVVGLLEAQGIPYMVTGSVASSFYGRPRSTHDARQLVDVRGILDATVDLDVDYIERWVAALGLDDLWRRVSSRP